MGSTDRGNKSKKTSWEKVPRNEPVVNKHNISII